jgi:hypothetical protein
MALTPGNSHGALNGTTPVDIVAAPAASTQRLVRSVTFFNRDTAVVTITLRLDDGGTERVLDKQAVQPDEAWVYAVAQVLDTATKKLEAVMSGAPATTNPDFSATWADKTA